jgi:CubicO group peptidase (beta-lactamase class C family)
MLKTVSPAMAAAMLLSVGAPVPAHAQPAAQAERVRLDRARIDAALRQMVASGRAAGVSALVWQDGAERYFGTTGFADREAQRPMARDTIVQIYSMTKPVTGVALMQLWEQGRFGLDDPLATHLPEFEDARVLHKETGTVQSPSRPILVRDILRHTAGFAYGGDPGFDRAAPLALEVDLSEMGRRVAGLPLQYDPGTEWRYSVAVDVQALLVERLTGMPFEAYVRTHVLEPLRMRETGWSQPPERLPRFAATYVRGPGALTRQPDEMSRRLNFAPKRMTMGGAGLAGPIDDYMRFARMLLNEGELDGVRILKPSTVRLMATDQLDPQVTKRHFLPTKGQVGFGFDFAVRTARPKSPAEIRGAVGEFFWDGAQSTLFWVDPANRLTAVFFVQTIPFDGTLHRDIRAAVYGPDYLGPPGDERR